jgi:hypothetical protein
MDKYIELVGRAADDRDGKEYIFNSSHEHASVIAANMFRVARTDISILSTRFNSDVYGRDRVIKSAKSFLSVKGRKLRVLVEDLDSIDEIDHAFLDAFDVKRQGDCFVRPDQGDVEICQLNKNYTDIAYNFMVGDDDCYRYEPDKKTCSAVAAFGKPETAKNLRKVFDELWDLSAKKLIKS